MKKHLTTEDVSAFLDGEHDRPEDVRKHLQQCAECARRHVALQKVSAHVKALPECEVSHGFAARVMRAVEQPQRERRRRAGYWIPVGAGLAAALAVAVAVATLTDNAAPVDDAVRTVAIEPAASSDVDLAGLLGPDGSEPAMAPAAGHDLQIAYASEVASRPVPHEFFTGPDYNESLVRLSASEKETLFQLLGSMLIDEQMM